MKWFKHKLKRKATLKKIIFAAMLLPLLVIAITSCTEDEYNFCEVTVVSGEGGTATICPNNPTNKIVSGWWVELIAKSEKNYRFVNWTVNGKEVSRDNPYKATINTSTQFKANFKDKTLFNNGHEYIDLGLSVKWATCNIGADSPEEYGDYFAWGETKPKSTYDWSTYKYSNGDQYSITKYCVDSYYGTVDNKTTLELSDDAARVNWGGKWRMPTKTEQDELRNTSNCIWTWTTQNGVNGFKVTSKKNGNSIFLPAAGYRDNANLYNVGNYGSYWSSSLSTIGSYNAYYLSFYSSGVGWYCYNRFGGLSVRAVCP